MSNFQPIFRSPITISERTASDLTGVPIVLIQGDAPDIVQSVIGIDVSPVRPGDMVSFSQVLLTRLTHEKLYLFGTQEGDHIPPAHAFDQAFRQAGRSAYAIDLTHGKAVLKLGGRAAAEALSKVCGLDFSDFPDMTSRQGSVAEVKVLVARCDRDGVPSYFLHVDRPMGQYFWEALWDAGQEFGMI